MLLVNQLIGFGASGTPASTGSIQFVGGKISALTPSVSTNTNVALNSGLTGGTASAVAAGDFVLAVQAVASPDIDQALTITDGTNDYTLVGAEQFVSETYSINFRVAYKFMPGTPDTTVTFGPTFATDAGGAVAVYVFSGVNATTPIDVTPTLYTDNDVAEVSPAAITPSTAGSYIVVAGGGAHGEATSTYNTPSELIDFFTVGGNGTGGGVTLGIGHKADWVSGAFTPTTLWTFTNADDVAYSSAAYTIALRSA